MQLNKLTAIAVKNAKADGRYADGGGLYLNVRNGGQSFVFIYKDRATGRAREMGLGPLATVSLQEARQAATQARLMLVAGQDPLAARQAKKDASAKAITFEQYALTGWIGPDGKARPPYIDTIIKGFANAKHRLQWRSTVESHAAPLLQKSIAEITTDDVRGVLEPIWHTIPETARRVRGRVERIMSAAKAEKLRTGENPAAWKDNLKPLLGQQQKSRKHHAALPYEKMPAFMPELRARDSVSASALEFTILCAARTNETVGAREKEFDLDLKIWTVPGERMKMKVEHRVPLSDRAVEIIKPLLRGKPNGVIFSGGDASGTLSNMAMLECLRDLRPGYMVHGFRSTFRDWAGDCTSFPRDLCESALAHSLDETEAAYRRSDALERRRELMKAWASYVSGELTDNVIPLLATSTMPQHRGHA